MNEILIDVGLNENGYTFRINPKSKNALKKIFPTYHFSDKLFVSNELHQDFNTYFGQIYTSVLEVLTQQSIIKLKKENFTKVKFKNPITGKILKSEML